MSTLGDEVMTSRHGYVVVLEHGLTSWSAYVPDLPMCVAVAETREDIEGAIEQAIAMHLEHLREEGLPVPHPGTPGQG
jgi:predicted RNase H-like HicB family nuclease